MRQRPSPNFSSRGDAKVSILLLHYTGMRSGQAAIDRLCEAAAKVSAHYVVEEDGEITQLVDEAECAWHAGVSFWRGHRNVNAVSVGIEIVNPGHEWGYRPFPQAQMEAVAGLCRGVIARHGLQHGNVIGHSDVAPQRKDDPGELFDWKWLAAQGAGVWPVPAKGIDRRPPREIQRSLAHYGYEVPQSGVLDAPTQKVIAAFQRHFRPARVDGQWDRECDGLLAALLAMG